MDRYYNYSELVPHYLSECRHMDKEEVKRFQEEVERNRERNRAIDVLIDSVQEWWQSNQHLLPRKPDFVYAIEDIYEMGDVRYILEQYNSLVRSGEVLP